MGVWRSMGGSVALRLVSSDIQGVLQILAQQGIVLYGVMLPDALTAEFVVRRQDLYAVNQAADRRGASLEQLKRFGIYWYLKDMLRRPVLIFGLLFLLILAVILPTRILFVRVEGNNRIATALIEETAAQCGIRFWASRREVRSERVKNRLLQSIGQLQWVGVNTSGCVATISVREKEVKDGAENFSVSRIVACRDGVISTVVCTSGNTLCIPGQAVREGQTLISGFTDCGLSIRAERAQGEVFAFTNREILAVLPLDTVELGCESCDSMQICVVAGKKRINLWKDSGISCTTCAKIYEEKWVRLPGGFRLPLCIVVERCWGRNTLESLSAKDSVLADFGRRYLSSQMLSGTILTKSEEITEEEAYLMLTGQYECLEMIGRERGEEIVHGKND